MKYNITISCLCFILAIPAMGQDDNDIRIAENGKKSMDYLRIKGLPVRVINRIPNAILGLDCDSNIVVRQNLPIGFCYWTVGWEKYYSVENFEKYKVLERIKDKLGADCVISGINYQGNIAVSYLHPNYFVIKGDSLFERLELDSISLGYINSYEEKNYVIRKELRTGFDNLTKECFIYDRFIFSNSKVVENIYVMTDIVTRDTIELQGLWNLEGKNYYELRIKKPVDNEYSNYSLQFDEKFRFIAFEGDCNITDLLTEESNQAIFNKK